MHTCKGLDVNSNLNTLLKVYFACMGKNNQHFNYNLIVTHAHSKKKHTISLWIPHLDKIKWRDMQFSYLFTWFFLYMNQDDKISNGVTKIWKTLVIRINVHEHLISIKKYINCHRSNFNTTTTCNWSAVHHLVN